MTVVFCFGQHATWKTLCCCLQNVKAFDKLGLDAMVTVWLNWRCRKTENPKRFWHCRSRVKHLNTCPFTRFQFDRTLRYVIEHIWILKPSCHTTLNGDVERCHAGKYYRLFKIALFSLQSALSAGDEGFVDHQLNGVVARSNRTETKIKQRLGTG